VSWLFGRFVGPRDEEAPAPDTRDLATSLATRRAEIAALEARLMRMEAEGARPRLHVAE
jgi:hypothetical protein